MINQMNSMIIMDYFYVIQDLVGSFQNSDLCLMALYDQSFRNFRDLEYLS